MAGKELANGHDLTLPVSLAKQTRAFPANPVSYLAAAANITNAMLRS